MARYWSAGHNGMDYLCSAEIYGRATNRWSYRQVEFNVTPKDPFTRFSGDQKFNRIWPWNKRVPDLLGI
jgi:hypothetical protein